jgi:hypothetical protein
MNMCPIYLPEQIEEDVYYISHLKLSARLGN